MVLFQSLLCFVRMRACLLVYVRACVGAYVTKHVSAFLHACLRVCMTSDTCLTYSSQYALLTIQGCNCRRGNMTLLHFWVHALRMSRRQGLRVEVRKWHIAPCRAVQA